jgi:hypothetical protein
MTGPQSQIPLEWLYARQRAIARTQNRYLLLLLLGSAYTIAAHLTPGPAINVPFLGLGVARALVETFAVTALAVLQLAFYSTGVRLTDALRDVHERFGAEGQKAVDCLIEETANVLDYLGSPGTAPTGWTRLQSLLLYHLPLLVALFWTAWLWWAQASNRPYCPPWLIAVHIVNALLLAGAVTRTVRSMKRRVQETYK